VFLPTGHRLFETTKPLKKHGKLHDAGPSLFMLSACAKINHLTLCTGESKPIKLMAQAFDKKIKTYIPEMLDDTFVLRINAPTTRT
jgi:hypothetical protein